MSFDIKEELNKLIHRREKQRDKSLLRICTELNIEKALSSAKKLPKEFDHPVINGRAKEIFITDLLKPLLYPNVEMCTGIIFDSLGHQSDQIDIIIYDKRIIPTVTLSSVEKAIPYEAVLATVEIKSKLTAEQLKICVKNAWSIKTLKFRQDFLNNTWKNSFHDFIRKFEGDKNIYQKWLEDTFKINSPILTVFAFNSSISVKNSEDELKRLKNTASIFNKERKDRRLNIDEVKTPISVLCIANSITIFCNDADNPNNDKSWTFIKCNKEHLNVTHFLTRLIDTINEYSLQRDALLLSGYF